MSDILLTWLNTEVDLSRQVSYLEKEFANGYLLGELLYKFNQLTNFTDFKDRDAKMKNYKILREVLTNVGIKEFTPQKAKSVQNGKKGEIQKLLYQIRSLLERKGINHENVSHKKILEEKYVSMKIPRKISPHDEVSQKLYNNLMEKITPAQKDVNLKKHLKPFEDFQKREEVNIRNEMQNDENDKKDKRNYNISQTNNESMRFHAFNQKFDQDGIENWKKNLISKKEREKNDLDFQLKEAKEFKNKIDNTVRRYNSETRTKIAVFEQNLEETNDSETLRSSDATIPGNERISSLKNGILDRITNKILKDPIAKTERDRRRRKIIVEQSKAQLEIENRSREEQLKSKLFKQSNQEKQLTYELFRIDQIKYIIRDDRDLRRIQYDEQNIQVQKFYKENEEHFLIQQKECFESDKAKEDQLLKELHISMRQKNRSVNSQACKDMVELIVDIVEEAYTYQQINDCEEIDKRVWREWTQLFINDHSLFNTGLANRNILSRQSDNPENDGILSEASNTKTSFHSTSPYTVIDRTLDDCEFLDYINYIGQWSKNLIPQSGFIKLTMNDFVENNQTNVKGNKLQAPKLDDRDEDPDNLVIPEENVKNPFFGNLIDLLIVIKHEDDYIEPPRKHIFKYIPIKLAIIGQDFSGKKNHAKILSENFPFKIYSIDKVLEEAFNLHKRLEAPVESEAKMYRSTQRMQMLEERKEEEAKFEQIKELVSQIKVILKNGDPIPDEIYVDLLIEFIKIDFPERSEEDIMQEAIMRVNEKEEILEKMKENDRENKNRPQTHKEKYNELQQNLLRANLDAMQGIVIVNFPNTYNQAKLLEKKLSNYIPDKPITQANILKENLSMLIDKSDPILPPNKLVQGGLDYIFYLNVPYQECIRRAIGRRLNSSTGIVYHLDDNPPTTDSNICEQVIPLEDIKNRESLLSIRSLSFMNTINYLVEFYEPFGFDKQKIKMFNEIDGFKNKEDITNDLIEHINKIVQINEENDLEIWNQNDSHIVEEDSRMLSEFADVSDEHDDEEDDEYTKNNKRISKIKKKINKELASVLLNLVIKMFENYLIECKDIFKFLRWQRDHITRNYDLILQKFIIFLKRPSLKQALLLEFQNRYNNFLDNYPDLVDDKHVKEEHHQQVDDLNDKIYEIIEKRKIDAFEERKSIMNSSWIENEMEKLYLNLEKLYQAEIDKFISSMNIIRDYYHNLDNRPIIELPFSTIDIVKEDIDTSIFLETENDFPKVDKLYKSALKVIFQYDQAIVQVDRERLIKTADKDSKNNKTKTQAKPKTHPDEGKIDTYAYEDEMRTALKNEKSKYKFRITLLKYWGMECLKKLRSQANQIYNKLEDWILLSIRSENQALNKVTNILRNSIEREEKIIYELNLDIFDVIINKDVQNYIELPPELSSAKEIISHERFNIDQIIIFIQELEAYVNKPHWIKPSVLIDILIKKFITSLTDKDVYHGIPTLLQQLTIHNYFKLIKTLDYKNTNKINIKHLITYFCILGSKTCTENDIVEIKHYCEKFNIFSEGGTVTLDEFITIPMWFDQYERSDDLEMYEKYNRLERLKKILFEVNGDGECIKMEDLFDIFTFKAVGHEVKKRQMATYFEYLFL